MEKKHILITGVCGFIGFHTAQYLLRNNDNIHVIGIDLFDIHNMNHTSDSPIKEHRLSLLEDFQIEGFQNFSYHKLNIVNIKRLKKIFKKYQITDIIHLAAKTGVRESLEEPKKYINSNIIGTFNLLESSKNLKNINFINASTSAVYSDERTPFNEDDNNEQIKSMYGISKKSAELITKNYCLNHKMNITTLRFFTVYGPMGRFDMSILKFIRLIDDEEPITIYGKGEQKRSFTYIDDVVKGIIKSLELTQSETINIGSDKNYPLNDMIELIEKNLDKKAIKKYKKPNQFEMENTLPDIEKANKLLSWQPEIDLEEGICKTIDWYNWYKNNKELVNKIPIKK